MQGHETSRSMLIEGGLVTGLFLVGLFIRAHDIGVLAPYPDELTYSLEAFQILGAHWAWPTTAMWDQPPLFIYILALFTAAFGATLDSLRMISVFFGSITIVFAYLLGKSMYGKVAGAIAATGVTFDGFQILYSRLLYEEALAVSLILCSVWLFWEGIVERRSLKLSIVGGIVFGLALDSKYISMVAGLALFIFLILYWRKFGGKFPKKQVIAFFSTSALIFTPVIVDLALNNVNPFYYDLVGRFQQTNVNVLATSVRSGQLILLGFEHFVQVQFKLSSTNPYGVFVFYPFQDLAWLGVVLIVFVYFLYSFFLRRSMPDALLAILFVGLLAFAFEYPGKRVYFTLYPSMVFMVMVGRVGQLAFDKMSRIRIGTKYIPIISVVVISLTLMALVTNMAAVPVVYQNGFGDWDEIVPITNYISTHVQANSSVATDLAVLVFLIELQHINVQLISMTLPEEYYTEPPINQTLMVPETGQYPLYYVLSTTLVEKEQPQFIILPSLDYSSTTTNFQAFINERYYQPLDTKLILLFEIRPGNQSAWNFTSCC